MHIKLSILVLLVSTCKVFAQQSSEWISKLENPKHPRFDELKPDQYLTKYVDYDLSGLLHPSTDFLGYIGIDYKRIKIDFNTISQDPKSPNKYIVKGSSSVSNNTCHFEGTITISQFREFKRMHFGVDDIHANAGFRAQGIAIGKYLFRENPGQQYSGVFEGTMTIWWYIDKHGNIKFDDIRKHSDDYVNNQYIGTWTGYNKSKGKVCNWGEYRIPFSEGLDIGAGEFSVNPKYHDNGWQDFKMD